MKEKGLRVKQIISTIRIKTDAIKARFLVTTFMLLSKKNNFSISAKVKDGGTDDDHQTELSVQHNDKVAAPAAIICKDGGARTSSSVREFGGGGDLKHGLFEEEEELTELLDDPNSSVSAIDMVKNSKEEGENFNLEDEIDHVADLFITKFHKRMRLQKLLSFKRNRQMLERST